MIEKKEKPIKVSKSVYDKLTKLKSIPEEPYSDVIKKLIISYENRGIKW